jgi:hypothetical protein
MQIKLRYVTSLTLAFVASCSSNDLGVGSIDGGAPPSGTGGSTTAGQGTGGTGISSGTGGSNATGERLDAGGGGLDAVGAGGYDSGYCNPFALAPKPIALATVIAAGKAADGTIYAADELDVSPYQRVFVSDAGGTLVRQHISGSGTSSESGGMVYDFGAAVPADPFVLQIEKSAGAVRMGVFQGGLKDRKSFTIGVDGEELTVLPSGALAGMAVRNFPGDVYVEYITTLSDGRWLLVTRPAEDWSYNDFRLFLGPVDRIAEHAVSNAARALDGGSTTITFDYDGTLAVASFRVVAADASFLPGPATLTIANQTLSLTRQSALPGGATYVCL